MNQDKTLKAETAKVVDKIMKNMDIDIMNRWIIETNELRHMLICGGINPKWSEMKTIPYPNE